MKPVQTGGILEMVLSGINKGKNEKIIYTNAVYEYSMQKQSKL